MDDSDDSKHPKPTKHTQQVRRRSNMQYRIVFHAAKTIRVKKPEGEDEPRTVYAPLGTSIEEIEEKLMDERAEREEE